MTIDYSDPDELIVDEVLKNSRWVEGLTNNRIALSDFTYDATQIGKILNISRERVRQIKDKALSKIRCNKRFNDFVEENYSGRSRGDFITVIRDGAPLKLAKNRLHGDGGGKYKLEDHYRY